MPPSSKRRFCRSGHSFCLALGPVLAALLCLPGPALAESLSRAVVNALLNSDARKAAQAELTATVNDLRASQSAFGPVIGVYADIRMEVIDNPNRFAPGQNAEPRLGREAGVTLSVPLYDGGFRAANVRRNAAVVDAEILRLIDSTETYALNAVQAYIDLARYGQIVELAQRNIARHGTIAAQVRAQIDGGRLPSSEGLRVDDRISLARLTRLDAERAQADALARYRLHIGHTPRTAVTLPRQIAAPRSREALVATAVENSARLMAVQSQINQLTHEGAAIGAEFAPQVNLESGLYAGRDMDGTAGPESGAYVGLRMDWTLYRGGERKHREAANRDRVMRQHYEMADQRRQITELAERTWNSYHAVGRERAELARQIGVARDLVATYQREFDAGQRPLFDVLEAERILFNYRVQDINAHASQHFLLYKMLAVQTRLAEHFGMTHAGRPLAPDFELRASANPRGGFDISAPPLDR